MRACLSSARALSLGLGLIVSGGVWGCDSTSETPAPPASTRPLMAPPPSQAPSPSPYPEGGFPEDEALPTEDDFAEAAEQDITPENLEVELRKLEAELGK